MSAVPSSLLTLIRPMRESDVEAVSAVERAAYDYPWTAGIFRDCLNVGYSCWVHLVRDDVVGHAIMSYGAGEAHLLNLCVDPDWHGQGIGKRLLHRVIRDAERLGASRIFLEVRPSNAAAVRLYQHTGYAQIGRRRDYYPDVEGREDALVMALDLPWSGPRR